MRITLSGATGFLGRHLVERLSKEGHSVCLLTRKPLTGLPIGVQTFIWNPPRVEAAPQALESSDAVIHLAGATVNQRWTEESKKLLRSSRLDSTRSLVQALSTLSRRPGLLLSASATGFYGNRGEEILTEESTAGKGFLAELSVDWEREANLARSLGMRVQCMRTGVVLGNDGGALRSMLPVFRLGMGGRLGGGQQWMSWIHLEDWVGSVLHLLRNNVPSGPFNLTAPQPGIFDRARACAQAAFGRDEQRAARESTRVAGGNFEGRLRVSLPGAGVWAALLATIKELWQSRM